MGLKDDIDNRFDSFGDRANELLETRAEQAEEDIHLVLGRYFGLAFDAIGKLIVTVGEIAEHIDFLESGKG